MSKKLYRSVNGDYLYLFNWTSGGFNDVWAPNKAAALKQIRKEFPDGKLTVNEKTLKRCTYEEYKDRNKLAWMMCM